MKRLKRAGIACGILIFLFSAYVVAYLSLRERQIRLGRLDFLFSSHRSQAMEVAFSPLITLEKRLFLSTQSDARDTLDSAVRQARTEKKNILLVFSGERCLPCLRLEQLIEKSKSLLTPHYIIVKIDNDWMSNGLDVMGSFQDMEDVVPNYIPFTVILDASGHVLETSGEMSEGAIGVPFGSDQDHERFMNLILNHAAAMSPEQTKELRKIADQLRLKFRRP